MNRAIRRALAILAALLVLGIVVLANLGLIHDLLPFLQKTPHLDKAGHFCLMGGLALLTNYAMHGRRIRLLGREPYLGSLLVFTCVLLEELSQIFIATRSFDFADLAADTLGILVLGAIGGRLGSRHCLPHAG